MKFIDKLQSSDESTKRRWMFVLSAASMLVVVFVWLAYFNNLVADLSRPAADAAESAQNESGFTFWQTTKNGAAIVYGSFADKLRALGETLNEPRDYIISPK